MRKILILASVLAFLTASWSSAEAQVRIGIGIGVPAYHHPYPYWYGYPHYYPYPYRVYVAPPPVYVARLPSMRIRSRASSMRSRGRFTRPGTVYAPALPPQTYQAQQGRAAPSSATQPPACKRFRLHLRRIRPLSRKARRDLGQVIDC